jgi:hypothetical protein
MKNRTVTISVSAPRDTVFNFLAKVENLPQWATEFCERMERRDGHWMALTSQGWLYVDAVADPRTGVIDMFAGPARDQLGLFPVRVIALPGGRTHVSFTFFQGPGMPDELYERQYQSLLIEMRGLTQRFGGGELHAA